MSAGRPIPSLNRNRPATFKGVQARSPAPGVRATRRFFARPAAPGVHQRFVAAKQVFPRGRGQMRRRRGVRDDPRRRRERHRPCADCRASCRDRGGRRSLTSGCAAVVSSTAWANASTLALRGRRVRPGEGVVNEAARRGRRQSSRSIVVTACRPSRIGAPSPTTTSYSSPRTSSSNSSRTTLGPVAATKVAGVVVDVAATKAELVDVVDQVGAVDDVAVEAPLT